MIKSLICLLSFAFVTAQAQNTTTGQITSEAASSASSPTGFVPFLGANAGYMDQSSRIETEGMPSSLKVLGSYYLQNTQGVFDLGLGVQNQQFSRQRAQDKAINSAAFEAAARYQFANRWQAGVIMNQFFNNGENYGANQADAQFAGLQALKEFSLDKGMIARAGGRVMTDLNVNRKTVNMVMLDFQLGWDAFAKKAQTVNKVAARTPAVQRMDDNALIIDESVTNFDVNSSEIKDNKESYLKKLADVLAANKGLVEEVQVIGHTDKTGTPAINEPLSERRAEAVASFLRTKDLGTTQVKTFGMAAEAPLSDILEKNRRTEVKFVGVKDEEKLTEILKSIE